MSVSHRVILVGFSAFERETLQACFRLAGARTPAYRMTHDMAGSDLIIADADQPGAVHAVGAQGRMHDTLFVGTARTPGQPAGRLPRPIDALRVQRALDDIVRCRAADAADAIRPRSERRNARPSGRARQQAHDHPELQDFRSSSGGYSNSVLTACDIKLDAVLVASDSPAEQLLLRETLARFGYQVELVRRGEEAVTRARAHYYGFVFLGVGMTGLDPFQTCRQIKKQASTWGLPPTVVLLALQPTSLDRIRATFAGCDAYLTEPLHDDELLHLLTQHDSTFERVFEPTAPQGI